MKKYHKTDIAPVEQENERDETYQASNPQIDPTRTSGNYHIVKRQRSYTQFINDKIEALDLPTKVRKDAVLMCSFVVGSDGAFFKKLSPQEQEQVLCRMHPLLCGALRRGQYHFCRRPHGRNHAAPAPEFDSRLRAAGCARRSCLTGRRLPHCRPTCIEKSARNGICSAARKEVRQNTLTRRSSRRRRSSSRRTGKQATSLPKQTITPSAK